MEITYKQAYVEVLALINQLPKEEYEKIPKEKIQFYTDNMDSTYEFKLDQNKDLKDQNISKKTYAIMINLFNDYFATEKQKETLQNLLKQNSTKLEEEKRKKYSPDNIFTKKENTEVQAMVEYKESVLKKIWKFIISVLKK